MSLSGTYRRIAYLALGGIVVIAATALLCGGVGVAPSTRAMPHEPVAPHGWAPPPYSPKHLVYPAASDPGGGCGCLYATPLGYFWGSSEHRNDLESVIREQSAGSAHVYERGSVVIRRGDIVIDGGAHLGVFTRLALLRGAGRVIAFEPQADIVECFRRTFAREIAAGQVTVVAKAVWDQTGTLEFDGSGQSFRALGSADTRPSTSAVLRMPSTTIDETVESLGLERVDFIKMDIEGAERQALRGARHTIARWKPNMAVCIYHRPDDPQAIPAAVREARKDYQVPKLRPGEFASNLLLWFPRSQDSP
jgi:FkbM family methyltransferase